MQEGMLYHTLKNRESSAYFQQTFFTLKGPLNIQALESSLQKMIERHAVLRSAFIHLELEQPLQVVLKDRTIPFSFSDVAGLPDADRRVADFVVEDRRRSFDLVKDTLIRVAVFKTKEDQHQLIFSFHHLILDGWSVQILLTEIITVYQCIATNTSYYLPPPSPFKNYIKWLGEQRMDRSLGYWKDYLDGCKPQRLLPVADDGPVTTQKIEKFRIQISDDQMDALKALARSRQVTMGTLFQMTWGILMAKYNYTRDVVFGVVVSGRPPYLTGIDNMLGLFVNTVPVRVAFDKDTKVSELLSQMQQDTVNSLAHQYCSLADIISKEGIVIDHVLAFQNFAQASHTAGNAFQVELKEHFEHTNYGLDVVVELDDNITVEWIYDGNRYLHSLVKGIGRSFISLLNEVTRRPDAIISELKFTDGPPAMPTRPTGPEANVAYRSLLTLFTECTHRCPDFIAVEDSRTRLTYRELDLGANRIAHLLINAGLKRESLVAVLCTRSVQSLQSMIGIFKAGGSYLPLDVTFPFTRILEILKDSDAGFLIVDHDFIKLTPLFFQRTSLETKIAYCLIPDADTSAGEQLEFCTSKLAARLIINGADADNASLLQAYKERLALHAPGGHIDTAEGADVFLQFLQNQGLTPDEVVAVYLDSPAYIILCVIALRRMSLKYRVVSPVDAGDPAGTLEQYATVITQARYTRVIDDLYWKYGDLKRFVLVDGDTLRAQTASWEFDAKQLWNYQAEHAGTTRLNDYGWSNSYSGEKFSPEEMQEYVDNLVSKLKPYLGPDKRVLEIGCGHGLVLFAIVRSTGYYLATDISSSVVQKNIRHLHEQNIHHADVRVMAAGEIGQIEAKNSFDIIVCSSAVHYFPNTIYLEQVIQQAMSLLKDDGIIYLDDLLDFEKKNALVQSAIEYNRSNQATTAKTDWESDLFVHKKFFSYLQQAVPEIESVEISQKTGIIDNELKQYRYDVMIHVNKRRSRETSGIHLTRFSDFDFPLKQLQSGAEPFAARSRDLVKVVAEGRNEIGLAPDAGVFAGNDPSDLAYVIYTSGSSGRPKGVMIEHRGMVNHLLAKVSDFEISSTDKIAQTASPCFDISIWQFLTALITGGTTVIYAGDVILSPLKLIEKITADGITILEVVPSYLSELLDQIEENSLGSPRTQLRYVLVTGEALYRGLVKRFYRHFGGIRLANAYGPTEASDDVTHFIMSDYSGGDNVPIGMPIQNINLVIADESLEVLLQGFKGEIIVSGAGIGRGYLNDPEKTAASFVPNTFDQSSPTAYRTGDIGRMLPNGNIEFFGRKDTQVKVRGHRIELHEIESKLRQIAGVLQSVVLEFSDGREDNYLSAFVTVSSGDAVTPESIKTALRQAVPEYMVPAHLFVVPEFPVTVNGKIDKNALRQFKVTQISKAGKKPVTHLEDSLLAIWKEVLQKEVISVDDNFFEMGGHSLKATRIVSRIQRDLKITLELGKIFQLKTISKVAAFISSLERSVVTAIPKAPRQPLYPVSNAQLRIWLLNQLEDDQVAYNVPIAFVFEGPINVELFKKAFALLVQRHESLRTIFLWQSNALWQSILDFNPDLFALRLCDVSNEAAPLSAANGMIEKEVSTPFLLHEVPLVRAMLYKLSQDQFVFLVNIHHIITDGWSMAVLFDELTTIYRELCQGQSVSLKPLEIQYKDYAHWQKLQMESASAEREKKYWLSVLSGDLPVLNLPTYQPRPPVQTYRGSVIDTELPGELTLQLKEISVSADTTLFTSLIAILNVLVYQYTGQQDIIFGTSHAGRNHAQLEKQVGLYIDTLVLRHRLEPAASFQDFLKYARGVVLGAFEHHAYPFDLLVNELAVKKDLSRSPLFDIMVEMQNFEALDERSVDLPMGTRIRPFDFPRNVSRFDMNIVFIERDGTIGMSVEYNTDLFLESQIHSFIRHFTHLATSIVNKPWAALSDHVLVLPDEQEMIDRFHGKTVPIGESNVLALFEQQALATPHSHAVVSAEGKWTYKELDVLSDAIARQIMAVAAPGSEMLVPVYMSRSHRLIATILAVWKCGAAYVPLDPAYPSQRVEALISDCAAAVVLANAECEGKLTGDYHIINVDKLSANDPASSYRMPAVDLNRLAYVIYTSGSTGKPKGVMIEHRGMLNHILAKVTDLGITRESVVAQNASQSFDISVWQMFAALVTGGRCHIYSDTVIFDPQAWVHQLIADKITILEIIPSYLPLLTTEIERQGCQQSLDSLQTLIVTGETVKHAALEKWFQVLGRVPVVNAYGPTETSDDVTHYWMRCPPQQTTIPIGRSLQNFRIYIINDAGHQCPVGIKGEICIAGTGVGRGYLNNPELTQGFFRKDPFGAEGDLMYCTGDLGAYLPDGNICFYGRSDHQVKVNGFRIELEEIEHQLECLPEIDQAAVVTVMAGAQQSIEAFITCKNASPDIWKIREALKARLPLYMCPSRIHVVDALPVTINGKTDRKELQAWSVSLVDVQEVVTASNDIEESVRKIWERVLGKPVPAVNSNFFEIGGNSIKLIQLYQELLTGFDVQLKVGELFSHTSVKAQAMLIANYHETAGASGADALVSLDF